MSTKPAAAHASIEDAKEVVAISVSTLGSESRRIRNATHASSDEVYKKYVAAEGEAAAKINQAKFEDELAASSMNLYIQAKRLSDTFDISEPLYETKGGQTTFLATEFVHQGQVLARLNTDGTYWALAEAG